MDSFDGIFIIQYYTIINYMAWSKINLLTTLHNIQRYKEQNESNIKLTTGYRNFENFHYQ
jgi:hypothetical protein